MISIADLVLYISSSTSYATQVIPIVIGTTSFKYYYHNWEYVCSSYPHWVTPHPTSLGSQDQPQASLHQTTSMLFQYTKAVPGTDLVGDFVMGEEGLYVVRFVQNCCFQSKAHPQVWRCSPLLWQPPPHI